MSAAEKICRYFQEGVEVRVALTPEYGGRTIKIFPFPFLFIFHEAAHGKKQKIFT